MKVFPKIYRLVAQIPSGKVATYGQIARCLGIADARIVGWALHANQDPSVPCHRVVNRQGKLAVNYAFGGWREQKKRLLQEGVSFKKPAQVDLSLCLFNQFTPLQKLELGRHK